MVRPLKSSLQIKRPSEREFKSQKKNTIILKLLSLVNEIKLGLIQKAIVYEDGGLSRISGGILKSILTFF